MEGSRRDSTIYVHGASMEPRTEYAEGCERVSGASYESASSMGPRAFACGTATHAIGLHAHSILQWGHALCVEEHDALISDREPAASMEPRICME
jgi:hypothetical protein